MQGKKKLARLLSVTLSVAMLSASFGAGGFSLTVKAAGTDYGDCPERGEGESHDLRGSCVTNIYCKLCKEEFDEKDADFHVDPKTGELYGYTVENAIAATAEEAGNTGDVRCKGCGELIRRGEIIPAYGNDYGLSGPVRSESGTTYDMVFFGNYWQEDTDGSGFATTADKKTPIKWRVLAVDGENNKALLWSDRILDYHYYFTERNTCWWGTSNVRSWLNGYGAAENAGGEDFSADGTNFISNAFTASEQNAILTATLDNHSKYDKGTFGKTEDKVFLLSVSELTNPAYGFDPIPPMTLQGMEKEQYFRQYFCRNAVDPVRAQKNTLYAFDFVDNCHNPDSVKRGTYDAYLIREPGGRVTFNDGLAVADTLVHRLDLVTASADGYAPISSGSFNLGICPAVWIDLSKTDCWKKAGKMVYSAEGEEVIEEAPADDPSIDKPSGDDTVSDNTVSDNTVSGNDADKDKDKDKEENKTPADDKEPIKEPAPKPEPKPQPAPKPAEESVAATKLTLSGDSKKIAAGKKLALTAKVTPENATDKEIVWTSSNAKAATVDAKGVVKTDKKAGGKTVTITASLKSNPKVTASYKITIMKDAVKSIKLSAKKSVKAGKSVTVKATVRATGKKVNKTLAWTSSNTKYATVNKKGVVKAKKAGKGKTVTITAKATDGSGKKATIKIKIK